MGTPKQIHLRDLDGNVKYNMLLDDGGPFLPFGGLYPYGFVDRLRLEREGLVIHEGWLTQEELDVERMRSPKAKLWLEYASQSERKRLQAVLDKLENARKTATA
jgi:hypothetical protein